MSKICAIMYVCGFIRKVRIDSMTIGIFIEGGLGNQLFQIFACIGASFQKRIAFRIPFSKHDATSAKGSPRPTYWDTLLSRLKPFLSDEVYSWPNVYRQPSFQYHEVPYFGNLDVRMHGYFQSYKFFEGHEDKIIKMLQIEEKKKTISQKYSICEENTTTISMHFRVGDYKHLAGFHNVLPHEYYVTALIHILSKIDGKDNKICVVCFGEREDHDINEDKIRRLKNEAGICSVLNETMNVEYVRCPYEAADWEQMLLMSCCEHNIIANSSFSWWGARLNSNTDKNVCYPSKWFGEKIPHDTSDMCPDEWEKINI